MVGKACEEFVDPNTKKLRGRLPSYSESELYSSEPSFITRLLTPTGIFSILSTIIYCVSNAQILIYYLFKPRYHNGRLQLPVLGWIWNLSRLLAFVVLLIPAWIQMVGYYFTNSRIIRDVRYGDKARRNRLDIYLPTDQHIHDAYRDPRRRCPVLVFIPGGAWIIGYKAWSALMGKMLMSGTKKVIFVSLDYRNFPETDVEGMIDDVRHGLEWVFQNIGAYGGDKENIFLLGQSAGAHLGMLATLVNAESLSRLNKSQNLYQGRVESTLSIRAFIGISGPFDMIKYGPHFHSRGLGPAILNSVFGCNTSASDAEIDEQLAGLSPTLVLKQKILSEEAINYIPPLIFCHGKADKTVSFESSVDLYRACQQAECKVVKLKLYEGKSHTDPIIEDPMLGNVNGHDELIEDILTVVDAFEIKQDPEITTSRKLVKRRGQPRLAPKVCLRLAAFCNPF
eukprot:CAMPEP_0204863604 /NCGR_PEP_ID=MMETSP1348-20121228/3435_1 /ASSEMBLY_ACC=CAM_ASM_000700 /TAXON_ID=215587 /ORGANISM="Aplanochytrium stocchinoi, Strain GSBS06" /LENGTH=452 /DNA_ID=CAMNT_0052013983 /DNA_START=378 /DNA_END=1736 /DNA_ORIENTATION=+